MDTMDVDCHPCASKQEQIVKLACREQGLGRAVERSKRSSCERVEVGFEGGPHPDLRAELSTVYAVDAGRR